MSFEPKLRRSRQERRTHTHTHSNPKYPTSSRPRNLFEINENQWFWDHFRPADPNLQNLIPWPWPGLPSQPSQPSQPALQHRQPVILATQVQATSYIRSPEILGSVQGRRLFAHVLGNIDMLVIGSVRGNPSLRLTAAS